MKRANHNKLPASYEDFRLASQDLTLSDAERIGFSEHVREGYEAKILQDWEAKIPALNETGKWILDVGCGASKLTDLLMEKAQRKKHSLFLSDSDEVLSSLKSAMSAVLVPGKFPASAKTITEKAGRPFDIVICYSVLQYPFAEGQLLPFVDALFLLLGRGGTLLLGDIPNASKRIRFLQSETGRLYHQKHFPNSPAPSLREFQKNERREMNDTVVRDLWLRYREHGAETYLLPQDSDLPLANRREDLLIVKSR